MQMENMYSGAETHSTSVQSVYGRTIDSICVLNLALEFRSGFQYTSWILVLFPELIGLKSNESKSCRTSRFMQMGQLFHCELGEGAQTLHEPGPPMLSSRHAKRVMLRQATIMMGESEGQRLAGIQYHTSGEN